MDTLSTRMGDLSTLVIFTIVTLYLAKHCHGYNPSYKTREGNIANEAGGVRMRISRAGMEYAADVATQILQHQVQNINIADQKGRKRLKLGAVDHVLTNIKLMSFTPPVTTITMQPFEWKLQGVAVKLTASWSYEYRAFTFFSMSDHGSLEVELRLDLLSSITLSRDNTRRLHVTHDTCTCHLNHVDVDFENAWLYNVFDSLVEKYLKDQLRWQVCHEIAVVINDKANEELASMPILLDIQDGILLDYSLVQPPHFASDYLDIEFAGVFSSANDSVTISYVRDVIPQTSPDNSLHMVGFWLTEHSISTLSRAAFRLNRCQTYITQEHLYPAERSVFKTTCDSFFQPCFGFFIPRARELYPDAVIEAKLFAKQVPKIAIGPEGISANLSIVAEFFAVEENSTEVGNFMFSLNIHALFNVSVELTDMRLQGRITDFEILQVSLNRTEIGDVIVGWMSAVVNLCMITSVIPRVDIIGQEGFPLPAIKHVEYVDPRLVLLPGVLYAGMDAQYVR